MGKVLPVGGIHQKIRAAYDAGVTAVLLPKENVKEAHGRPSYILDVVSVIPVETIEDVLAKALLNVSVS